MECTRLLTSTFMVSCYFCMELTFSNGENVIYNVLTGLFLTPWKSLNTSERFRRSNNFTSFVSFDPGNRAFVVNKTDTATAGNPLETAPPTPTLPTSRSSSASLSTSTLSANNALSKQQLFTLRPRQKPVKLVLAKRKFIENSLDKKEVKQNIPGILTGKVKKAVRRKLESKIKF